MSFVSNRYRFSSEQVKDGEGKKQAVVLLRWVLVITTSCLILFSNEHGGKDLPSQLVVLALILSNVGVGSLPSPFFVSKKFDSWLVTLDIVLVSAGLWISGNANGDFYLLYFLIIMIAALGETLRSILWSAFLVAIVYVGVIVTTAGVNSLVDSSILMRIPFFFIVAIFYGYFAQLVRSERSARVNFQTKYTLGQRLRELGSSLSGSLDRQNILETLVRAQSEFCQVPYCGVISRGSKAVLAESGDTGLRPSAEKMNTICASLERRILSRERGRNQLSEADEMPGPTVTRRTVVGDQQVVSFLEGNFTLVPISPMIESDLYLLISGVVSGEILEYVAVLMLSASMALNNSAQYQALVHEVEKRQEVNRQLSEAVHFKSQFLANISHEIRTPLHSFIGFGELFLNGGYGDLTTEQSSVIQRMVKNAGSLLELINGILDLSKLEAGGMKVRARAGEISEFLSDISETCMPLLSDKPVALNVSAVGNVPVLIIDWGMLRQIAINLISNAIKFTARGRIDVTLRYEEQREHLTLVVRDTGVGIEPEKFAEIFEPFRQLENSYTKKYAGTGLGLAISKGQAELLGGTISVKSKLGSWSEFTLDIPTGSNPLHPPTSSTSSTPTPPRPTL
ncbi:MAG: ATP-binding protein [Bdellovibrionota bacterium]